MPNLRNNEEAPEGEAKTPKTARPVSEKDKDLGVKTGIVKRFGDYDKPGYGHLLDSNNHEYFVHYTDIVGKGFRNLAKGQHVKFHGYEGEKGLYAKEVSVVNI